MKKGAHGHYFIPFNRYNPQIIDSNQALYVVRSKVWFYLPDRHEAHPQERIVGEIMGVNQREKNTFIAKHLEVSELVCIFAFYYNNV